MEDIDSSSDEKVPDGIVKGLSDRVRQIAYEVHEFWGVDIWKRFMRRRWFIVCINLE